MPSGQPTPPWSATASSPVFGESTASTRAGAPYRTIFLALIGYCQLSARGPASQKLRADYVALEGPRGWREKALTRGKEI